MKIATDLSVVAACEILIDAVNITETYYGMNSPIDYGPEGPAMEYEAYDERSELRSSSSDRVESVRNPSTSYAKKPTVQLRTFFPENWLFDIMDSDDGILER